MFHDIPEGKVIAGTETFAKMRKMARSQLSLILRSEGSGIASMLGRHVAYSKLNAQISFHGWAIRRDGSMFEVRVRGEPVDWKVEDEPLLGSKEDINDRARRCYISTGLVVDPQTGRRLPRSERHRFGII